MNKPKDDLDRYLKKALKRDPSLKERLERVNQAWDIAMQVRELREEAGITQAKLADLVGTRQSNIARLESADYTGYTLKTLEKITKALRAKLEIRIVPETNSNIVRP